MELLGQCPFVGESEQATETACKIPNLLDSFDSIVGGADDRAAAECHHPREICRVAGEFKLSAERVIEIVLLELVGTFAHIPPRLLACFGYVDGKHEPPIAAVSHMPVLLAILAVHFPDRTQVQPGGEERGDIDQACTMLSSNGRPGGRERRSDENGQALGIERSLQTRLAKMD